MTALFLASDIANLHGDLPTTTTNPHACGVPWCDSRHHKSYGPSQAIHVGAWSVVDYSPGYPRTVGYIHRYQDDGGGKHVRARVLTLGGRYVWRTMSEVPDGDVWDRVVKRALAWVNNAAVTR